MGDRQARALERDTSLEGRARVLAHRLRVGTLTQERLELAAYVGDEAARMLVERWRWDKRDEVCCCGDGADGHGMGGAEHSLVHACDYYAEEGEERECACPSLPLDAWARSLSRWDKAVCVRAAVAAGRVAWAANGSDDAAYVNAGMDTTSRADPVRALSAAQAWLDCPCERHLEACVALCCPKPNLDAFAWEVNEAVCCRQAGDDDHAHHVTAIETSGRLTSEQAVRDAIRTSLVPWALARP